jgi:hypothetical protein
MNFGPVPNIPIPENRMLISYDLPQTKVAVDEFFKTYCDLDLDRDWYEKTETNIRYKNDNVEVDILVDGYLGYHWFQVGFANTQLDVLGAFFLKPLATFIP